MKRYVILFLLLNCFVLNSMAQNDTKRLTELRKAYNQLATDKTQKAKEDFFRAFPESWREFLITDYEMNRNNVDFVSYVDEFARISSAIDDTLYCAKLLDLTHGAYYDVDCPGMVHKLLHGVMGDDSHLASYEGGDKSSVMLWLLSTQYGPKLKGDILRFWQFYWSLQYFEESNGVHNDYSFNDDYKRLCDIVAKKYPDMLEPMTIAYQYFHHGVLFIDNPHLTPRYARNVSR